MRNWNPMTADEPDPWPQMRQEAIEARAETLMNDEGWIETALSDGINCRILAAALAADYIPEATHSRIGGLLMDALWDIAVAEATKTVDDGE